jgi:uncharacterized protein YrrD
MLRKLHDLIGYKVDALDDSIGSVDDFYFDDHTWTVRYIVIDTGPWLVGRRVLLSPDAVGGIDSLSERMAFELSKEQIENSPSIDADQPVSREYETALSTYYGWPGYWTTAPLMGMPVTTPMPVAPVVGEAAAAATNTAVPDTATGVTAEEDEATAVLQDSNLRSVREVTGYHVHATDGDIGHVQDIFAGENDWIIRYFLVDTRNWWPGKHVLVGQDWVESVDWSERSLVVNVTRQQVKDSPEYEPGEPLHRDYETSLHNYYLFPGYWV